MSTRAKMSLAEMALQLRDEQLQARIVHYKADLATSPELDAVTESVVAELKALQAAANKGAADGAPAAPPKDRAQLEIELIGSLKRVLGRLFRPGELTAIVERKIAEVSKRFARMFFESELCERIRGTAGEPKTMRFAPQALYLVLARNHDSLVKQLDEFDYQSPVERKEAKAKLEETIKELRNEFLSETTPELNMLVGWLNHLLRAFFTTELPPAVGELAWEVVKEARLAEAQGAAAGGGGGTLGAAIGASAFPGFRATFERKFLQRLVAFVEDGMLERVRAKGDEFRAETLRFVSDPRIFMDVCELVCDAVYDFLYNDGFLDLPSDWRARLASAAE